MPKPGSFAPYLAVAVATSLLLNAVEGAQALRKQVIGVPSLPQTEKPTSLGPFPPLDPISRFVPPIDPWQPGGFGWEVEGQDDLGAFCTTNRPPTPSCDPNGPRAFLHAGFDAAPATDRVVHASAAGRV